MLHWFRRPMSSSFVLLSLVNKTPRYFSWKTTGPVLHPARLFSSIFSLSTSFPLVHAGLLAAAAQKLLSDLLKRCSVKLRDSSNRFHGKLLE